jgi:limonene-1,2-epoxide hydrolase
MGEMAERAVLDFMHEMEVEQWDEETVERVVARMTPDASYSVYAWEKPVTGHDAIRAELTRQVPLFRDFRTEIKLIASTGQKVLVERVDSMIFHERPLTQHIAAVYEVADDGQISSWRDYYDSKEITAQLGSEVTTAGSRN